VEDALLDLGQAGEVDAAPGRFIFRAHRPAAADRTVLGHEEGAFAAGAAGIDHLDDLRDDIPGALNDDPVADADILAFDLILVVQGGAADGDAADLDRLHDRHRGEGAGAADLDLNIKNLRHLLAGRKLEGDRPARAPASGAKLFLVRYAVDLDDDAVDFVGELLAPFRHGAVVGQDRAGAADALNQRINPQPQALELVEHPGVSCEGEGVGLADAVAENGQGPAGGDPGVKLTQRSRRSVARIGEERLAPFLPLPVQSGEFTDAEDHLAADLKPARNRIIEFEGNRFDRPEVAGDLLAGVAVAAGGAEGEEAVDIDQLDGQAVELGLADILDLFVAAEGAAGALVESEKLLLVQGVVEAEHGHSVGCGGEGLRGGAADALGG